MKFLRTEAVSYSSCYPPIPSAISGTDLKNDEKKMNGFLTAHSVPELFGSGYHEKAFCESTHSVSPYLLPRRVRGQDIDLGLGPLLRQDGTLPLWIMHVWMTESQGQWAGTPSFL